MTDGLSLPNSIYDLPREIFEVAEQLENLDYETEDEMFGLKRRLDALLEKADNKAEVYMKLIKRMELLAEQSRLIKESLRRESEKLEASARLRESSSSQLRDKLLFLVTEMGRPIRTSVGTAGTMTTKHIIIETERNVPEEFFEVSKKLLKSKLNQAVLKGGLEVEGVSVEESLTLVIRG